MKKAKKIIHTEHPQHEILAMAMIGIGLILIFNDFYFFWPPFAVNVLNDDLVGGAFLIDGILLLNWAFSTPGKIYANRRLLVLSAGLLAFEACAEFCHGYVSGRPHMLMAGFLEVIILCFVFSIIGKSQKHEN